MAKIRTRARALDMLGRQQIAGIPTALSELFKNAHDAYADRVEVDYIRKQRLLILRDDGLGMTREEFEQRWLTIGTDSKLNKPGSMDMPVMDSSKPKREIMGEKGIGRLAIAAIGPLVLVITRAKREEKICATVVALINWELFSLPGIDLDDIEIPIENFPSDYVPNKSDIDKLIEVLKINLTYVQKKLPTADLSHIEKIISDFSVDPLTWEQQLEKFDSNSPTLLHSRHGTHFFVGSVDEVFNDDIEPIASSRRTERSSRLQKALLGFTNTMYVNAKPPILTKFRDHLLDGECKERIGDDEFFTPKDFEIADHHIKGQFNEYGQFEGTVSVYGNEPQNYVLGWSDNLNQKVSCGEFKLNIAYVQGRQRDTKLPPELWKPLTDKTDRIGGLYVYRDGIRILPYGDTDNDFLRIEQRRTKSASEYFFSYRRMFGTIELTKNRNSNLQEKAGREGFIENKAYKQIKSILENFFIQLAIDFFNEKGELADTFIETRARQQKEYELLKKRAKLKTAKKNEFDKNINEFFDRADEGYWDSSTRYLTEKVERKIQNFDSNKFSMEEYLYDLQASINQEFQAIEESVNVSKPNGIGLGKDLQKLWDKYQVEKNRIATQIIAPAKNKIEMLLSDFEKANGDSQGFRRRLEQTLKTQKDYQQAKISEALRAANNSLSELENWIKAEIKINKERAKISFNTVDAEFASTSLVGKQTEDLIELKKHLEDKINDSAGIIVQRLNLLSDQIRTTKEGSQENGVASNLLIEVLESEIESLREEQQNNSDMVQLGMAISVIHHEFEGNIRSIRKSLLNLKPWADKNPKLNALYKDLRAGFDHLDGYLNLFTPLSRRLNRRKIDITGNAIYDFVKDVFQDRLEAENIELEYTQKFNDQSIKSFTSTIYPAFINLIDNAIHWVSKINGQRIITLDATAKGFKIIDNGPGISIRDRERIFEYGFSRKLGGRGMGLYISKTTLERAGLDLYLADYKTDEGACFIIESNPNKNMEDMENE